MYDPIPKDGSDPTRRTIKPMGEIPRSNEWWLVRSTIGISRTHAGASDVHHYVRGSAAEVAEFLEIMMDEWNAERWVMSPCPGFDPATFRPAKRLAWRGPAAVLLGDVSDYLVKHVSD